MGTNDSVRRGSAERKTSETAVKVDLILEGTTQVKVKTPSGFFNHMLDLMAYHGGLDLALEASGDTEIDDHHLVEDTGLILGQAFKEAVGDKSGIIRYADLHLPMDEALVLVVADVSGRPHFNFDVSFPTEKVGNFELYLVEEFLKSFVNEAKITLHIRLLYGKDPHHIAEAIFKGFGRCLSKAVEKSDISKGIPSTKGTL